MADCSSAPYRYSNQNRAVLVIAIPPRADSAVKAQGWLMPSHSTVYAIIGDLAEPEPRLADL